MSEVPSSPSYPALNSCVLIDSRMSSRIELKSYIVSTNLFENIIEPESINAGFKVIMSEEVDTCIFGPSVKSENVKGFLIDLQISDYKGDCAFLSTYRAGEKEEIENIHAQVEFPCSRQIFNAGIVQALQNANGGYLPPPKRKDPITGETILLKDALDKLDFGESVSIASKSQDDPNYGESISISSKVSIETFTQQASELAKVLDGLDPHNLMFRPNGTPSSVTSDTVKNLISKVFPSTKSGSDLTDFKCNLELLLYTWIQNATQSGRKVANSKLREGILAYFSGDTET